MKPIAIDEIRAQPLMPPRVEHRAQLAPLKTGAAARCWLRILFWVSRHARWLVYTLKPAAVWAALRYSPKARVSTVANARRIFGPEATDAECAALGPKVVGNFIDFVVDVARSSAMSATQLRQRIEAIEGRDRYVTFRKQRGGGAIIVTAHMGSFEVGLAALADVEPNIHVVFKRDALDGFENLRRALRQTLNVGEAPIDEGWETWMRLRDALVANHVVVMQGDRAMPGQKAHAVPILGGHVLLPLGPVKLAQISGSPIIPVITLRTKSGRCRLFTEEAIYVDPHAELIDGVHPAYPEQWLVLDPAFIEDVSNPGISSDTARDNVT
jgi:KDO2-lipid IV(A) lauroyltransferase